jgi:hypothetical protein
VACTSKGIANAANAKSSSCLIHGIGNISVIVASQHVGARARRRASANGRTDPKIATTVAGRKRRRRCAPSKRPTRATGNGGGGGSLSCLRKPHPRSGMRCKTAARSYQIFGMVKPRW